MSIPVSSFQPLVRQFAASTVGLAAQIPPTSLLRDLAMPLELARLEPELREPTEKLNQLVVRGQEGLGEDIQEEELSRVIFATVSNLRPVLKGIDNETDRYLEVTERRWDVLSRTVSSIPVRAQHFSSRPPPMPNSAPTAEATSSESLKPPRTGFDPLDELQVALEEVTAFQDVFRNWGQPATLFVLPKKGAPRPVVNSASFEEEFGYKPGEIGDRSIIEFFPRAERMGRTKRLIKAVRAGQIDWQDVNLVAKDGTVRAYDIHGTTTKVGDETLAIVLYSLSRTRRDVEEQLIEGERIASYKTLIPAFAHDFGNVLQAVRGAFEMIRERIDRDIGDKQSHLQRLKEGLEMLGLAEGHARYLLGITSDGQDDEEPVELDDLISAQKIQFVVGDDITLETNFDECPWVVAGPMSRLWQPINNVVKNAAEAVGADDEGRIFVETSKQEISRPDLKRMRALAAYPDARPGEFMRIRIRDNGMGIPDDKLKWIFEPFKTAKDVPHSLLQRKGHTGIGLWSTREIVAERGGFIDVQSVEGEGTTFDLYLPRIENPGIILPGPASSETPVVAPVVVATREEEVPSPQDGNEKLAAADVPEEAALNSRGNEPVLVVDDESQILRMIDAALGIYNYDTVLQAPNGRAAVKIIESGVDIRLLITDLNMPRMNGTQVIEAARAVYPDLPVIVVTGGVVKDAPKLPRLVLLLKPFKFHELAATVRAMLDNPDSPPISSK